MVTLYLDPINGNDANDGTSFALRVKTVTSGITAARVAPGDVVRMIESPPPVLIGSAVWTRFSRHLTLPADLTKNISNCDTIWTAAANVTPTVGTSFRQGTGSASLNIAAGHTTGLVGYTATGLLDLSAYTRVSLWVRTTVATLSTRLSLSLCSDTAGAVAVNTFALPALPIGSNWQAVVLDNAGPLGSNIQSVALNVVTDAGAVTILLDNIVACKSEASGGITHHSLLGKKHAVVHWAASTSYAENAVIRPTNTNRNGYQYRKTGAGSHVSASTEPAWPLGIGTSVTDGGITWACEEVESRWYAIQYFEGDVVGLELTNSQAPSELYGQHEERSETVDTYKREPHLMTPTSGDHMTMQDSGAAGSPITYSGGWNASDMTVQSGQSWFSGQAGSGQGIATNSKGDFSIENLGFARMGTGFLLNVSGRNLHRIKNCQAVSCTNGGLGTGGGGTISLFNLEIMGCSFLNNGPGISMTNRGSGRISDTNCSNNLTNGMTFSTVGNMETVRVRLVNNDTGLASTTTENVMHYDLYSANNKTAGVNPLSSGGQLFINSYVLDTVPVNCSLLSSVFRSSKHDGIATNHLTQFNYGSIVSATDQRHTASGISWKFRPTSLVATTVFPLEMPVATVAVGASLTTVSVWVYRDSTDVKGLLLVKGLQIAGVKEDVSVACEPVINTWTQYTLTFTPTETGVVEILFKAWDGVGTTNNLWIDDLTVT